MIGLRCLALLGGIALSVATSSRLGNAVAHLHNAHHARGQGLDHDSLLEPHSKVNSQPREAQQQLGDRLGCDKALRTGTWSTPDKQCTVDVVGSSSSFLPKDRWDALDCSSAWRDTVRIWLGCYAGTPGGYSFSEALVDFFHLESSLRCGDPFPADSRQSPCGNTPCIADSTPETAPEDVTGACTYELWNSMAFLYHTIYSAHYVFRNEQSLFRYGYIGVIEDLGLAVDKSQVWNIALDLFPLYLGILGPRYYAGEFAEENYFGLDQGGTRGAEWQQMARDFASIGFSVAKTTLSLEASRPRDIELANLTDVVFASWTEQLNRFATRLFDGSPRSLGVVGRVISDGKLMDGWWHADSKPRPDSSFHTRWSAGHALERGFYAVFVPAVWAAAGKPSPVVLDFGEGCVIDATGFFREHADAYNKGWRCIDGHSYILAGAGDESNNGGRFGVLKGIDKLERADRMPYITADDLITGAIRTWERHGRKNVKVGPLTELTDEMLDIPTDMGRAAYLDVIPAGWVRIPVCGAEEALANLKKGRKSYGDSPNYPCNP